ncbi:methyl-accepting chemotaxis protein [Kushneria aurantia]|uniref:Methyl-accepting chemotaxis protein n=1 Tax=Kushneria aurantia TaxID=504092 RepID=A0ABV6G3C9_9GAMM|nr:PAS domain-containing methyl-accepting chemotaxis protein [Kushneria aurantia]
MRNNQPVYNQEFVLTDDDYLISRTDASGQIAYANPAFVKASGFPREELIGAPHNLVRHPDMPAAAFENLWKTLKKGEAWSGIIKNRRKDGGFYWVQSTVTPIFEAGRVVGYTSVRVRPSDQARRLAERVYPQMRAGQKSRYRLDHGELRRRGTIGWLQRLSLRSLKGRLITLVAVALAVVALGGGLSLSMQQGSQQSLQQLSQNGVEDIARLQQIDQLMGRGVNLLGDPVNNPVGTEMAPIEAQAEQLANEIRTAWQGYHDRQANRTPAAGILNADIANYLDNGIEAVVTALGNDDYYDALMTYNDVLVGHRDEISQHLNALVQQQRDSAIELATQASQRQQTAFVLLAGLFTAGLAVLLLLGLMTIRAVLKPLREALDFTLQIASGNLAANLQQRRNDDVGRLIGALDRMKRSLVTIVEDVNGNVAVVRPATHDIASGNGDISRRTEQQSNSLAQTASSMEEMTATVKQNADNARQASELADGATASVRRSGEVMNQVVDTMHNITEGSKRMADIVGVIDSIAFQTNLLALNASVEAARAGEQGRGFAVVAGEVRNLAGRSAEAAREIRELIDGSGQQVSQGAELVHRAEVSIGEVVDAVTRVNDIIREISAASGEQTSGIEQISQAVAQIDEVTRHNAEQVQTTADSAGDLRASVEHLTQSIAVFRLPGSSAEKAGGYRALTSQDGETPSDEQASRQPVRLQALDTRRQLTRA